MDNEEYSEFKQTYRQQFASFKKSTACFELKALLLRLQRYQCPVTKKTLSLNDTTDLSHIIPVSLLEKIKRRDLLTSYHNLFLEEGKSNRKRKDKIVFDLLPDLLDAITFSETELQVIRNAKTDY